VNWELGRIGLKDSNLMSTDSLLGISGWWVKVKMNVANCNPYKEFSFQCTTTFSAVNSDSGYTSTSSMMISGAALLGVLAFVATRKRRVASIDLAREEQQAGECTAGDFEMMSDSGVIRV
jgi:LPXTG-motif cell wall-anchored protein